jgi:ABC-type Fe3+ transport system permease subunit
MLYTLYFIFIAVLFLTGGLFLLGAFNNWKWLKKLVLGKRGQMWNDSISSIALGVIGVVILVIGLLIIF